MVRRKISIIGSTGSIGRQALEVLERLGDKFEITALAGGSNTDLLLQQAEKFRPKYISSDKYDERLGKISGVKYLPDGLEEICSNKAENDIILMAVSGKIGLKPTLTAIENGIDIALANKETLVMAGDIVMKKAREKGVKILPVDSEHSAIFQSMQGENRERVSKLLITASGGPFRGKSRAELENVRLEDALHHPNWSMGNKITIDSATLVNKGLEVMEAKWLFDVDLENIQVVVHPQSIIHSMVEYVDGGIMAQLGTPDMKLPIQYALFYPDRRPMRGKRVDFYALGSITFEKPDMETFTGLKLAMRAAGEGGSVPTVFNAANERAVSLFLNRKIRFLQIAEIIEMCMDAHKRIEAPNVEEILASEQETYELIATKF